MKKSNAATLCVLASRVTAKVKTDWTPADTAWRKAFVAAVKADALEQRKVAATQRAFRKMLAGV